MTVALEGGEWSAARPGRTLPPGKTWHPLYRRLCGPQGQSGRDLYRGISDYKKGYQPRNIIVKDEKGDLVTEPNNIFASWRKEFFQLFSVHGVSDIRHIEIHTAEPLVPELSAFEVEMAIERLKVHKWPGID